MLACLKIFQQQGEAQWKDLIRAVGDVETTNVLVPNVKVSVPGLQKLQQQEKRDKKREKREKQKDALRKGA